MERQYLMLVGVSQFKFIVWVNTFETVLPRDVLKHKVIMMHFLEKFIGDRITCDCRKSMTLLRRMWHRWLTPPSLWPSRTPLSRPPALMWSTRRWAWMKPSCCRCYPCPLKIYKCADSVEWVQKKPNGAQIFVNALFTEIGYIALWRWGTEVIDLSTRNSYGKPVSMPFVQRIWYVFRSWGGIIERWHWVFVWIAGLCKSFCSTRSSELRREV